MAAIDDLKRLEDQLYQYYPELKQDSEDVKLERRNQLFMQLRSSYPVVQLPPFDAVSSLTNIKELLEKCKDCVQDPLVHFPEMNESSASMSVLESSGDELLSTLKSRRKSRKRKSASALVRRSEIETRNELKEQDSPLSLSILIPQVVKGSEKMEISIDLGGLDASQRLFGSRVEGLLRNRSNSSSMLEDLPIKEKPISTNKSMDLQVSAAASNTIETFHENNNKQEDEMLSNLISQVLVDNHQSETLQATNVLDNINNNEISNYDAGVPVLIDSSEPKATKTKRQRKPKKTLVEKGPPKKRGRKPKNKSNNEGADNFGMPKSDLAKYVELFSNTCNMAGSATPAASSTVSQQMVTSTTHYLEPNGHQPITYYLEGDWENGGSCQLIQTENAQIDNGQEEFNMAELVNYIDNVGDTTNVIARVLDAPTTLPILVQDSHVPSNSILPPPAHISDVLLDLSKKSATAHDLSNAPLELVTQDILPLDLSTKSLNLNETTKEGIPSGISETATEQVLDNNDYDSFGAALDMPLIDIEDNINAFMELTNSDMLTSATEKITTSAVCAPTIEANTNNALPMCDFELSEILGENTLCRSDCNIETQNDNQCDAVKEKNLKSDADKNVSEQYQNINDVINDISETVVNADHNHCEEVGNLSSFSQSETNLTQDNKTDSDKGATAENNIPNTEPSESTDFKNCEEKTENQCMDRVDDSQTESSDKSSIDFLFMDTESLLPNKTNDGPAAVSETNTSFSRSEVDQTANVSKLEILDGHDDVACDLSTKDAHSKSIDLIEDDQCQHVSVQLPMPQLTLMDSSSEEFHYDSEFGFESSQEKEDIMGVTEKPQLCEAQQYDQVEEVKFNSNEGSGIERSMLNNGFESTEATEMTISYEGKSEVFGALENGCSNEKNKDEKSEANSAEETITENGGREASTLEDSAICCKQEDANANNELETETSELNNHFEQNRKQDVPCDYKIYLEEPQDGGKVESYQESTQKIAVEPDKVLAKDVPDVVKTCKHDSFSSLSVLEIESKLDDVCLDFDDELEDDAMSLATSCFNSSDDERFPELDKNYVDSPINTDNKQVDTKLLNVDENYLETAVNKNNKKDDTETLDIEKQEKLDDKSNIIKVETTNKSADVSIDIFKKFKIPKISLTSATTKHSNPAVIAAVPLPMVILPPNAFKRQVVKTEQDSIKAPNFENITRTVQNVCAVTPLTLQPPTHTSGNAAIPQNTLTTVRPLIRDILQLAPSLIGEDLKDFKAPDTQQFSFNRGEFGGNGGDGRNFGPPTVVVAETFGVTCLPFLVGRCFTLASCKFSHTFRDPAAVRNILITLSEVDLNVAYRFAYNHEQVFRRYMHEFCRVYFERNNRLKLLHLVRDCERYKGGGELLVTIFHSLQYCGLNKVNACRQILSYSRDRSIPTIDALMNIILEADWTMFCDHIEKFSDISSYHFRLNVLHQMASTVLRANDQRMTSLFFKCLVNLDPKDVGLVQTSPILMQLLELIKNGQICR